MTALICGSMAFDSLLLFEGRFKDHILPDRIHMLNVSFLVPSMRRRFGGGSPRRELGRRELKECAWHGVTSISGK